MTSRSTLLGPEAAAGPAFLREAHGMSEWGRATYGDPCRECGYDWSIAIPSAMDLVRSAPQRYLALLDGREGSEHGAGLAWSATGYVCHVADNLRIWAERLAGAAQGGSSIVAAYDSDALAEARNYDSVAVEGALWSLRHATEAWGVAVEWAQEQQVVLMHPERGSQTVNDMVRNNSHDAHHHGWDIQRILAG